MDAARLAAFEQDVQAATPLRGALFFVTFFWASKRKFFNKMVLRIHFRKKGTKGRGVNVSLHDNKS